MRRRNGEQSSWWRWGLPAAAALLLAGFLAGAAGASDQPGLQQTPTVQLSSRAPAGAIPGIPDWVYNVDAFEVGDDIWAAIPQVAGGQDLTGRAARVYVVPHRPPAAWKEGAPLLDASGGFEAVTVQAGSPYLNHVLAWPAAAEAGSYDLVVDLEPFGSFQRRTDLVDHGGLSGIPGFRVLGGGSVDYLLVSPQNGCARIFGVGVYPGGLYEPVEPFVANGWNNGANGTPENGGGDDVFLGAVSASWSTTIPARGGRIHPETGLYVAAYETEEGTVTAAYPGATSGTADVMTTAPSWAP